jgi:hypothetical protein
LNRIHCINIYLKKRITCVTIINIEHSKLKQFNMGIQLVKCQSISTNMTKTDITFTLIPSPIKSISFRIYSLAQDIILTGKKTIA